jgi:integrase
MVFLSFCPQRYKGLLQMGLTYLHNRNGNFYFRMGLPTHLQKLCGQREWVYALQTKNYTEAKQRCTNLTPLAHALLMKIEGLFRENQQLPPKQVQEVVRSYFAEALRRLKQQKSMYEEALPKLEFMVGAGLNGSLNEDQQTKVQQAFQQPLYLTPDSLAGIESRDSKGRLNGTILKIAGGMPLGMTPITQQQIVDYALKQSSLKLEPSSVAYKQVSQGIERAINELHKLHQQYTDNQPNLAVEDKLFEDLVKIAESPLWSEVTKQYLAFIANAQEPLTQDNKRTTYTWFQDFYGDLPIQAIQKTPHATGFRDALTKLPTNASKHYKGQTFKHWLGQKGKKISERRINIYISSMKSLFAWAKNQGLYEGENPFSSIAAPKTKVKQAEKKGPYTADQLTQLFASPIYTGHSRQRFKAGAMMVKDSLYWIPLLALFTGARREELCQLKTTDIRQEQGVWVMDVNDAGDNHLKNDSSLRKIPLHPQLEKLGFLTYHKKIHASRDKMLFPDLIYSKGKQRWGNEFGKKFNAYLKNIKLRQGREDFHSFRHTLTDALREAGVQSDLIMAITGHKDSRVIGGYGKGFTLQQRYDALAKVQYPSIEWAKVGLVKPLPR